LTTEWGQTNVALPLPILASFPAHKPAKMCAIMETKHMEEWDCFAVVFVHNGKWWTRCCAQIFNEVSLHSLHRKSVIYLMGDMFQLSDFDYVGKVLSVVCAEMRKEFDV
jgi:hercynylcysteine S-oxide lyase